MKRPRSLRGRGNNTTVKPSYLLVNFCCESETAVSLFQKADIILVPHSLGETGVLAAFFRFASLVVKGDCCALCLSAPRRICLSLCHIA